MISPEILKDDGFLKSEDLHNVPRFDTHKIDFGRLIDYKYKLLRKAFENFKKNRTELEKALKAFEFENKDWLEDFTFFMAAKDYHGGKLWTEWDKDLVLRKKDALGKWKDKLADGILFHKFIQFNFFKQWDQLKKYVNEKGIKIIGDMPIFIAYDSADLWSHKDIFTVDKEGKLINVAGVPPDYFSATGQRWGNPLFKWEEMEKDEFGWWRRRIVNILQLVDIVRIDHFRGFDKFWQIPGDAATAQKGKWVKAPGDKFFKTLKKHLGELPIIAEDLGLITKSVIELRDKFNFPGMKILQFAFGKGMEKKFLPHNYVKNCVVYTGSHDNDTTRAYFEKAKKENNDIFKHAQKYLNYYGDDITFELIRTAYASSADTVVLPMQDILNLGGEARMNFPGTLGNNWTWRFTWELIYPELAEKYRSLAELYERPPEPEEEVKEIDNP
jgi:4-alpha-glucanotransferase